MTGGKDRRVKGHEHGTPNWKDKPKRKPRVDIAGLAPARDYWSLKSMVLARPHGGEGVWRKDGSFLLIRAGLCERHGFVRAVDAHHRLLVSQGGADVASNLAALCRDCHDWCHQHPKDAAKGGWIVPPGQDFRARAILIWDGSIATLDDEAGYGFQKWPTV